mgnify:FL=1
MKALKIFVAAVLLSVCGLAGSDSVALINLDGGEDVNGKNFTIVAKGWDYAPGTSLRIEIIVTDLATGEKRSDLISVTTK